MKSKGRRRLVIGMTAASLILLTLYAVFGAIEEGGRFYRERGQRLANALQGLGQALRARDFLALQSAYSSGYSGRLLGLASPQPTASGSGIQAFAFLPPPQNDPSVEAALEEWRQYLSGYERIDDVRLDLRRLDRWESADEIQASVRFELSGLLADPPAASHDWAYLRMRLALRQEGLEILEASLELGERVTAASPWFEEAQQQALQSTGRPTPQQPPGETLEAASQSSLRYPAAAHYGAGLSAVDYDGDGRIDLFLPGPSDARLLRNLGNGDFQDVTSKVGIAGLEGLSVALFADYDNDGRKDLVVAGRDAGLRLFRGNQDGTFLEETGKAGFDSKADSIVSAAWADYDRDGDLDLYLCRHLDARTQSPPAFLARNGQPNLLYRNDRERGFTEVAGLAGVADRGLCLGAAWGDIDLDGWPDLLLANEYGPSSLYRNLGQDADAAGRVFADISASLSQSLGWPARSATFLDFDNDGDLDILLGRHVPSQMWPSAAPLVRLYLLNSLRQESWTTQVPLFWRAFRSRAGLTESFRPRRAGGVLLRNEGRRQGSAGLADVYFADASGLLRAGADGWTWGAAAGDLDNDGFLDAYLSSGWIRAQDRDDTESEVLQALSERPGDYARGVVFAPDFRGGRSWQGWQRNRLFRGREDGFREIASAAGAGLFVSARGVALADFSNRGSLDIALSSDQGPHVLLRNRVDPQGNWLQVSLVGVQSSRDAAGALVRIFNDDGRNQTRQVSLGGGYASQEPQRLHFGLGDASVVLRLDVRWPQSGEVQSFENIDANQSILIREGEQEPEILRRPPRTRRGRRR